VSGRPRRCKLAHAFQWEYSNKRLKLAQLRGQLGVFLTSGRKPRGLPRRRRWPDAARCASKYRVVRPPSRSTPLQPSLERDKVLGRPRRRTSAHAFRWEHSYKRLKLAQLLGPLGVLLTWPATPASRSTSACCKTPSCTLAGPARRPARRSPRGSARTRPACGHRGWPSPGVITQ
jgi:hypothetical protein